MPTVGATYTSYRTRESVTTGELGTPNTITWEITIRKNDDTPIDHEVEYLALQVEGHIPYINDPLITGTAPTGMTWQQFCRARSISFASGPRGVLVATVEWSTLYMVDPVQESVAYVLPSSVDFVSRTRSTTLYRTSWTVQPPTTSANISADVGGNAITGGFVGKPEQVNQVAIRVRIMYDASAVAISTMYANKFTIVGKRNSAALGGFPAYSLVCEGLSMNKVGNGFEFYEATFDLLWDNWYHFEQVPVLAEGGLPKQNASFGPEEVFWQRIALSATDFAPVMFPNGSGGVDTKFRDRTLGGWWVP